MLSPRDGPRSGGASALNRSAHLKRAGRRSRLGRRPDDSGCVPRGPGPLSLAPGCRRRIWRHGPASQRTGFRLISVRSRVQGHCARRSVFVEAIRSPVVRRSPHVVLSVGRQSRGRTREIAGYYSHAKNQDIPDPRHQRFRRQLIRVRLRQVTQVTQVTHYSGTPPDTQTTLYPRAVPMMSLANSIGSDPAELFLEIGFGEY
jgi:hypothetical protein